MCHRIEFIKSLVGLEAARSAPVLELMRDLDGNPILGNAVTAFCYNGRVYVVVSKQYPASRFMRRQSAGPLENSRSMPIILSRS
jgi:hypothetical protein